MPNFFSVPITFATTGDQTLVTGVAAKMVQIFKILITAAGTTNLVFKDGTGGTALTGPLPFATNEQLSLPFDTTPIFFASPGNNFVVNSSTAVQVSGVVWYSQR
jgi:hypothetical protein